MPMPTENQNKLYECPACHLAYRDAAWAKKCEDWCTEHHSCNLQIIVHAEPVSNKTGSPR